MTIASRRTFSPTLSRRNLLQQAFFSALALAATPTSAIAKACLPVSGQQQLPLPVGPLNQAGALQAPDVLGVAVPAGFRVKLLAQAGDRVSTPAGAEPRSVYRWHTYPDGGAVFARPDGGWIYTSNSEIPLLPLGGCGAIGFEHGGEVDSAYSILQGTTQNCAGGKTPWNTWLSCEESSAGLCYECDPYRPGQGNPKPALGRFAHEAASVDALRDTVYLTEDAPEGRFYRWVAGPGDRQGDRLAMENGQLQVMNLTGYADDCYPESDVLVRNQLSVQWVPVVSPTEPQAVIRGHLRDTHQTVPGTRFTGGEGLWNYRVSASDAALLARATGLKPPDVLVFWTTKIDNRVWVLDVVNQVVEIVFDNAGMETPLHSVDNLTVSPWGDVLVAEDPVRRDVARLVVLQPNRGATTLLEVHHPGSEICGPAFSPDGSRLYFSSQRYRKGGATFEVVLPQHLVRPAAV